jgi:cyclic pyranopterin phosphate synthase
VDAWGRVHTDLRLSVTDRCNLRCTYCMPEEGVEWLPRGDLLGVAEIERVARVAYGLGVRSVRLTGGEPLLRPGLVEIVARVAAVGFDDLAMTTNAMSLARLARRLAEAGLRRVNVSCDSLDPRPAVRVPHPVLGRSRRLQQPARPSPPADAPHALRHRPGGTGRLEPAHGHGRQSGSFGR